MLALKMLTKIRYPYYYDQTVSLVSNILKQNYLLDVLSIHEDSKQRFIPRIYTVACRKIGSLFPRNQYVFYESQERVLLDSFYKNFFRIDTRFLSPAESLDVLFFIRCTQGDISEYCDKETIKSFFGKILHQLLFFLPHLDFNKHVDIIFELSCLPKETFPVEEGMESKIYDSMLIKLENTHENSYSSFHFNMAYNFLQAEDPQKYPRQLFIRVIEIITQICQDLPAKNIILSINKAISCFEAIQKDEKIKKLIIIMMRQMINSLLTILQTQKTFMEVQTEIFYQAKEELQIISQFLADENTNFNKIWRMKLTNCLNVIPKINKAIVRELR